MDNTSKGLDEEEQEKSFLARHKVIILIAAGELTLTGISAAIDLTTGIFSQGMYGALGSVAGAILGSITLPVVATIGFIGTNYIAKAIDYVISKNREESLSYCEDSHEHPESQNPSYHNKSDHDESDHQHSESDFGDEQI
jgi:hypothetical protein